MSERAEVSFDAALMMALRADAQKSWMSCQVRPSLRNATRTRPDGMLACKRRCINAALC